MPYTTISSEFEFRALGIEADLFVLFKQKFEIKKECEIQILVGDDELCS